MWKTVVRWGETDAAGFVFYPTYFGWFDEATHYYLTALGLSSVDLFSRDRIGVPIFEAKAVFRAALHFGDSIRVSSAVDAIERKTFRVAHQVWRGETLVAEGYEVRGWVQFGPEGAKAGTIPEYVRDLFQRSNPTL